MSATVLTNTVALTTTAVRVDTDAIDYDVAAPFKITNNGPNVIRVGPSTITATSGGQRVHVGQVWSQVLKADSAQVWAVSTEGTSSAKTVQTAIFDSDSVDVAYLSTLFAPITGSGTYAQLSLQAATRRLKGVRSSGLIPVADHAMANPGTVLRKLTLSALVSTTPAFGTSETWTVASIANLPASGQQVVGLIDGEQVLVTAYASTSITVIRGVNGYVVAHANGAALYLDTTAGVLSGDGGRVTRRRHQVNVLGGLSSLAPDYGNWCAQIDSALYGEVGAFNPIGVRAMIEVLSQPPTRGPNGWQVAGGYSAGQVVSDLGISYIYTASSTVGTHPASDGAATSLGDSRHIVGSTYDPAFTYANTNVVFWRGAYWTATGATTGNEPKLGSTFWTVIAPTGRTAAWSNQTWAAGAVVSSTLPGSTWPAYYMSLGMPTTANPNAPSSNPVFWGLLTAYPVEFVGQDATRMVTIQPGGSAQAIPLAEDLAQGAYFFLTTWVAPISTAASTTPTLGAAGFYPLSGNPLAVGIDNVSCGTTNAVNPGAPTNYAQWNDFPINGPVPLPSAWSSGTTYAAGNVVSIGGSYYRSLQSANTNHTPTSSSVWWDWIQSGYEPTAILGAPTLGIGRVVSLAVRGDSIVNGSGDTFYGSDGSNLADAGGYVPRGIANSISFQRVTKPGDFIRFQTGNRSVRRRALHSGATHVLLELGVNDLTGRFFYEEIADWMTAEWVRLADQGLLVAQTTITPVTTTSDAWATLANQTTSTTTGMSGDTVQGVAVSERQKLNTWLRTIPAPLSVVVDVAAKVEVWSSAANSGSGGWVWQLSGGVAATADGTHPVPAVHAAIAADATTYATNLLGFGAYLASLKAPIA